MTWEEWVMSRAWAKRFVRAVLVRTIRSSAQAFASLLPTSALTLGDIDWPLIGTGVLLYAAASAATAIVAGLPEAPEPPGSAGGPKHQLPQ